jgi:LPS export ABC transporter protein LptC
MSFSCKNELDRVASVEVRDDGPDRITLGAEYLFTDSGRVRNRLMAGRIEEFQMEPKHTLLTEGVKLVFHASDGSEGSVLTARRGVILPDDQRMEVFENVVFINAKGERLETEALTWRQDSAQVHTDKAVRIVRGQDIIYGQGLVADEDFSRYRITDPTGELVLNETDTLSTDAQAE